LFLQREDNRAAANSDHGVLVIDIEAADGAARIMGGGGEGVERSCCKDTIRWLRRKKSEGAKNQQEKTITPAST